MIQHEIWWKGPHWLSKPQEEWPSYEPIYETELEKRKLPAFTHFTVNVQEQEYLVEVMKKHSTLSRLLWNTAYVTKFCSSSKSKKIEQPNAQELRTAMRHWTLYIQAMAFKDEIERLKAGDELLARSKLLKLRPFVDQDGASHNYHLKLSIQ